MQATGRWQQSQPCAGATMAEAVRRVTKRVAGPREASISSSSSASFPYSLSLLLTLTLTPLPRRRAGSGCGEEQGAGSKSKKVAEQEHEAEHYLIALGVYPQPPGDFSPRRLGMADSSPRRRRPKIV